MSFAAAIQITDQDTRTVSSTPGGEFLGQLGSTPDGRTYRYTLNGGVALTPGTLNVNADVDSNVVNEGVNVAAAVGSRQVQLDAGGNIAANAYAGGYLTINDAAGEGISYYVTGNTAGSTSVDVQVYLQEPITVALTTSSEATLTVNPYSGVVISIADQADQPVGVSNVAVPIANYCWLQTGGICSVLADEAIAKGLALTTGSSTVGAVEALDGAGEPQVGIATMAMVDTEYQPAYLTLW